MPTNREISVVLEQRTHVVVVLILPRTTMNVLSHPTINSTGVDAFQKFSYNDVRGRVCGLVTLSKTCDGMLDIVRPGN